MQVCTQWGWWTQEHLQCLCPKGLGVQTLQVNPGTLACWAKLQLQFFLNEHFRQPQPINHCWKPKWNPFGIFALIFYQRLICPISQGSPTTIKLCLAEIRVPRERPVEWGGFHYLDGWLREWTRSLEIYRLHGTELVMEGAVCLASLGCEWLSYFSPECSQLVEGHFYFFAIMAYTEFCIFILKSLSPVHVTIFHVLLHS